MKNILQVATLGNEYFQRSQPWVLIKQDPQRCRQVIYACVDICRILAILLCPYLPASSRKIYGFLKLEGTPTWDAIRLPLARTEIAKPEILFKKFEKPEIERIKSIVTKSTDAKEYFR